MTTTVAANLTVGAHIVSSWGEAVVDSVTANEADVFNEDHMNPHHISTIQIQVHYILNGSFGFMQVRTTDTVELA